jgi:hypothetical protein
VLHGFRFDIRSYVHVIPLLVSTGLGVMVPYLRGRGPTRFTHPATPRSGQQAAPGANAIALLDVLGLDRASLASYDVGGRAACVAALVHAPHRRHVPDPFLDRGACSDR